VYGIRCAASKEFKSLGRAEDITGAQHCRAEVYLTEYGWVPVDPADVRKVVLEENAPGAPLSLDDPRVQKARGQLFGAWEMNWVPYNYAHDVRLPHAAGPELSFLMYPQAETAKGRKDSLDPKTFTYTIKAKEI
jgi:transglutaminase-like putative cysteine protease